MYRKFSRRIDWMETFKHLSSLLSPSESQLYRPFPRSKEERNHIVSVVDWFLTLHARVGHAIKCTFLQILCRMFDEDICKLCLRHRIFNTKKVRLGGGLRLVWPTDDPRPPRTEFARRFVVSLLIGDGVTEKTRVRRNELYDEANLEVLIQNRTLFFEVSKLTTDPYSLRTMFFFAASHYPSVICQHYDLAWVHQSIENILRTMLCDTTVVKWNDSETMRLAFKESPRAYCLILQSCDTTYFEENPDAFTRLVSDGHRVHMETMEGLLETHWRNITPRTNPGMVALYDQYCILNKCNLNSLPERHDCEYSLLKQYVAWREAFIHVDNQRLGEA